MISTLKDIIADYKEEKSFSTDFAATIVHDILKNCVKAAPTVDAVPVRHGKWIDKMVRDWHCSECDYEIAKVRKFDGYCYDDKPNFCPNCGADMREETT